MTHFTIHLEPDVTLRTALDHRTDSHQPDDQGLALLNRNVHFLAYVWASEEITRRNHTDREETPLAAELRGVATMCITSSRHISEGTLGTLRRPVDGTVSPWTIHSAEVLLPWDTSHRM